MYIRDDLLSPTWHANEAEPSRTHQGCQDDTSFMIWMSRLYKYFSIVTTCHRQNSGRYLIHPVLDGAWSLLPSPPPRYPARRPFVITTPSVPSWIQGGDRSISGSFAEANQGPQSSTAPSPPSLPRSHARVRGGFGSAQAARGPWTARWLGHWAYMQ